MRRKFVALLALIGGAVAGFQLFRRIGGEHRRTRVDLYYEDGSHASLPETEAAPLLDIARNALRAARA
jgi:hypothetical protein